MRLNKDLEKFTEKHLCWSPILMISLELYIKSFCKIFKNSYLVEHLRTAAGMFHYPCQSTLVFISTFYFDFNFLGQLVAILILLLEKNYLSLEKQIF